MATDRIPLLVFVKYPEPGRVKTRLADAIGTGPATAWYKFFVTRCLDRFQQLDEVDCTIFFDPIEELERLKAWLGEERRYLPQPSGDLGDRLAFGVTSLLAAHTRVIAIGTDSPDLPLDYIKEAGKRLHENDLVLGPAEDGGYYLIGMKQAHVHLFDGIDWSTPEVLRQTLAKSRALQLKTSLLPTWYDVDTLAELERFLQSPDGPGAAVSPYKPPG
jgi:uncharacterized protein